MDKSNLGCKFCKYYNKGECQVETVIGRKVLVEEDFYCNHWIGVGKLILWYDELNPDKEYELENQFGGEAFIRVIPNRYNNEDQVVVRFVFSDTEFTSKEPKSAGYVSDILKSSGFNVSIL